MSNKQKLILRVYAHGNPEIIEHSEEIETFLFDLREWIEAQSNGYVFSSFFSKEVKP